MESSFTLSVPAGAFFVVARRIMPPVIEFGSPVQRSKGRQEHESFWHIPIRIRPKLFKKIGPGTLINCRVFLDWYDGDKIVDRIRMCWGDFAFEKPAEVSHLHKDVVSLVPVVWRTEEGEDRNAYFTSIRYFLHGEKDKPINSNRSKHRFRLRVKSGKFERSSPHFYITRVPVGVGNGHFTTEIEYEGEGTVGGLLVSGVG